MSVKELNREFLSDCPGGRAGVELVFCKAKEDPSGPFAKYYEVFRAIWADFCFKDPEKDKILNRLSEDVNSWLRVGVKYLGNSPRDIQFGIPDRVTGRAAVLDAEGIAYPHTKFTEGSTLDKRGVAIFLGLGLYQNNGKGLLVGIQTPTRPSDGYERVLTGENTTGDIYNYLVRSAERSMSVDYISGLSIKDRDITIDGREWKTMDSQLIGKLVAQGMGSYMGKIAMSSFSPHNLSGEQMRGAMLSKVQESAEALVGGIQSRIERVILPMFVPESMLEDLGFWWDAEKQVARLIG